jgi:hypothetical protein
MMSFVTFVFFHILISYMIDFWATKTFGDFIFIFIFIFEQIRIFYYTLQIASYH